MLRSYPGGGSSAFDSVYITGNREDLEEDECSTIRNKNSIYVFITVDYLSERDHNGHFWQYKIITSRWQKGSKSVYSLP